MMTTIYGKYSLALFFFAYVDEYYLYIVSELQKGYQKFWFIHNSYRWRWEIRIEVSSGRSILCYEKSILNKYNIYA